MLNLLQSATRQSVGFALDGLHTRYEAIATNVANAETPGYKAVDVQFEDALATELNAKQPDAPGTLSMAQTQANHLNGRATALPLQGQPLSAFQINTQHRADQNGVDMDKEMAIMSKTGQRFLALSHIEGKLYKSLRSLITNNT
jgi:flagellar basal-body rod protein FlgB